MPWLLFFWKMINGINDDSHATYIHQYALNQENYSKAKYPIRSRNRQNCNAVGLYIWIYVVFWLYPDWESILIY